jgi:hypothetical protein
LDVTGEEFSPCSNVNRSPPLPFVVAE